MEIAEAKGAAKGIAAGKAERDIEITKNLLEQGMGLDAISTITGLSIDEIENIKNPSAKSYF